MSNMDQYNEFEALLNEYLPPEEKGKVKVTAKISQVDRNFAYLDAAGQPTAIRVRTEELEGYNLGEEIEIILIGETEDGEFLVGSRRRVDMEEGMKIVEQAFETKEILNCKIIKKINGGYILEFMKQQGFLPNSLSEIPMKDSENAAGKSIDVMVKDIKMDKKGKRVTFSKKDITLQKSAEELASIKIGDVLNCDVSDVLEFGVNIRYGSVRGFVHISEISWKKIDSVKGIYTSGDKIQCKVLAIDLEKKNLKLSIKMLTKNPWEVAKETVIIGEIVEGKITRVVPYGVFVEVTSGVEGLVHASDFTWNKKKINVSDFVKIGDIVKVKIMDFDASGRKLKLGIKQLSENPWSNAEEKFALGTKLSGKILEIKNFGIFVEISNGVDAFIHQSDVSWQGEEVPKYKIGETIEFAVSELNKEENKIKGSIKILQKSPWDKVVENYKVGDKVQKDIKTIMDFGMFVNLEKGIDGFIPTQLASKDFIKNLKENFQVGQSITAEIIEIDKEKKKIKMSIKKLELDMAKTEEKELIEKYSESSSK
ncbi:MAG: S1 RNA-binding domain-containing protein [Fusobacteriaceae bacterium]